MAVDTIYDTNRDLACLHCTTTGQVFGRAWSGSGTALDGDEIANVFLHYVAKKSKTDPRKLLRNGKLEALEDSFLEIINADTEDELLDLYRESEF